MLLERKVERMLPWIILLCIVGLALVFAEMLIPGFGVFGILGSVCLLGTAFLVAKVYGITAFLITVVLLVIAFALMIVLAKKSGFYNKVVLRDKQEAQDFDESTLQGLLGAEGVTQTTLRPYGVADFQGKNGGRMFQWGFHRPRKARACDTHTGENRDSGRVLK